MQQKITGFLLLITGAILLIYKSSLVPTYTFFNWFFLFTLIGFAVIFLGFLKSHPQYVLWGGITSSISLFSWGKKYIDGWPTHWSIFLIFVAITILLMFVVNKQTLTGLLGGFLLLTGIFAWPGVKNYPFFSPVGEAMNTYWPILLVILGFIFLLRKN